MNYALVAEIAARLETCAVIGAYAMAARGYVRQTADFDILTTDRSALTEAFWDDERRKGLPVDIRRGDFDDPLKGVARIRSPAVHLDVVVAKYKWQGALIDRSEPLTFGTVALRVPRLSDLVLLKVDAGSHLDLHDAAALMEIGPKADLVAEINAVLPTLPEPVQQRIREFLARA